MRWTIYSELEETIAAFKRAEAAITYPSGYVANLAAVSTRLGRGDFVFDGLVDQKTGLRILN